jgi:hypothetical protein
MERRWGQNDPQQTFFFPRLRGTAGYKRNGETHTSGLTANAYLTYEKNRPDSDSSAIPVGNGWLEFTPQGGLELDNALSAADVSNEGAVTRALASVKASAYPLASQLRERLIVSVDLTYRHDVQTDFADSDRDHPFAQVSVTVTLDPYKVFSVSVDRVVGEDPTQDFDGPAFTRFAFKVQLTKPQKRTIQRLLQAAPAHII